MADTTFMETEALMFILKDDYSGLDDYLRTFNDGEIRYFCQQVEVLYDHISSEIFRRTSER